MSKEIRNSSFYTFFKIQIQNFFSLICSLLYSRLIYIILILYNAYFQTNIKKGIISKKNEGKI